MPTINNNPIPSMDTSWENYSGQQVENFIKQKLTENQQAAAAAIKGVKVNASPVAVDSEGNALINVETTVVDQSLDSASPNAISNAAVQAKVADIEDTLIRSIETEDTDDGQLRLIFQNRSNGTVADVTIPKGGGEEGEEVARIRLSASISPLRVKEGGSATLTYTYEHRTTEGANDGTRAIINIRIRRGANTILDTTLPPMEPSATPHTMDITNYLQVGTVEVTLLATATLGDGTVQTRQAYASVYVAKMELRSDFNIADTLTDGGYPQGETFRFPYRVEGVGQKTVWLYVDGTQTDAHTVTASQQNREFSINTTNLAPGRHNIQVVAECDNIRSQTLYRDFLVRGATAPYIGCAIEFQDGRVYTGEWPLYPYVDAVQFNAATIQFVAWTPGSSTSEVEVRQEGVAIATMTVNRTRQTYTTRFERGGTIAMALATGDTVYPFHFSVASGSLAVEETASGMVKKLTATGRSNSDANRADWGGITTFEGVDWQSSGWAVRTVTNAQGVVTQSYEVLRLINGATATIDYRPFATDAKAPNGMTVEMELYITNVANRDAAIVSCMDNGGMGFRILAKEAQFLTGGTKPVETSETDEHGNVIMRERPVGVAMDIASDMLLKIAFVLHNDSTSLTTEGNRLMQLYINGILSKVDQYQAYTMFMQSPAQPITIDSAHADVDVRSIRIYNRALSASELLDNYIVDRPSYDEIEEAFNRNDILDERNEIDLRKVIDKGRGAMVIIPQGQVDAANSKNNKKADFAADKVYWYSPFGEEYDFVAQHINFRIQGTSSTKYPRKNYRLYLAKTAAGHDISETVVTRGISRADGTGGEVVNPKIESGKIKGNKVALRPGGMAENLFCMKADYSDSSMVQNTGGAKLFNDIMIELGLLTPPQRYQLEHGGSITVRQAIDGIPCDLFVMAEDGGATTYYGQYNLNNEKSKSGKLFGMEGVSGFEPTCPIALEGLNNGNPFCLFQSNGTANSASLEQQLLQSFDDGFEFNYPEDIFYNPENGDEATADQKAAIKTLMGWLYDVTPLAMRTAPDYGDRNGWDKSKWVSQDFKQQASQHFDVAHLCTYYLFTEYWASVDQRAKNILWRTWDGQIWYATFYDGDTAMSMRNDGFMAYLYDMTRDTYDAEANKFAYEGHNSRLWCLLLANMEDELKTAANNLRTKLTTARMLQMFNQEQQRNWAERQYNESGWFKYVKPYIEGVNLESEQGTVVKMFYNYLYALTGSREAHRTAFLSNRAALLDARYETSSYTEDNITAYLSKNDTSAQTVRLLSGDLYYYGYRTNNSQFYGGLTLAENGAWATITFNVAQQLNDPIRFCGASRILELDWTNGPTLGNTFEMGRARLLQSLNMSAANGGTRHQTSLKLISIESCTMLQSIDVTGQQGISTGDGTSLDLRAQTRLATLRAGGTGIQQALIAEGAPITTLVLPNTVRYLFLRYLPNLTMQGLDVEGYANVQYFSFAACPHLDWQQLLARCTNAQYIRVEGITGRIDPAILRQYANYGGIKDDGGIDPTRPRLVGEVTLTSVVTDVELLSFQETYPDLTIHPNQYTEYIFHDLESDPANITNMDNHTGYAYRDNDSGDDPTHPNGYYASGHVALLHDMAQPVRARFAKAAGESEYRMTVEPISKTNYLKMADGITDSQLSDPDNLKYDFFLHLPRYKYKGVNYYRRATKHFFLTTLENPRPSYTQRIKMTLAEIQQFDPTAPLPPSSPLTPFTPLTPEYIPGKAIVANDNSAGYTLALSNNEAFNVYRLPVKGMALVRFPATVSPSVGSAFTTANGSVIATNTLSEITTSPSTPPTPSTPSSPLSPSSTSPQNATATNPLDFNAETIGGYDILAVPDNAEYIYFTAAANAPTDAPAIATDSDELEGLEDWVTHQPELIGLWQATKDAAGNIRSRSPLASENIYLQRGEGSENSAAQQSVWDDYYDGNGRCTIDPTHPTSPTYPIAPPTIGNYSAGDFLNLCQLRGPGFHAITYETSKNLANIIMAWLGTRYIESIIGEGGSATYHPGHYHRGSFNYADSKENAGVVSYNNVWGMEAFTGTAAEWMDDICINAPSFATFLTMKRDAQGYWEANGIYHVYADGEERSIATPNSQNNMNAQRMTFGKRCDIIASTLIGDDGTYSSHYTAQQYNVAFAGTQKGGVPMRSGGRQSSHVPSMGLAYLYSLRAIQSRATSTTRLCYTGPYTITET